MIKIVADEAIPFLKGWLDPYTDIAYYPASAITHDTIEEADGLIIRTRTPCNAELLHETNVKHIASATVGYDHIDTQYCLDHGIDWTNTPGANAWSVVQYVITALLELAGQQNFELRGKTLGIVGVGNVGQRLARAAAALGMHVLLNDPPREKAEGPEGFTNLTSLVHQSDIISFHVPLHQEGRYQTLYLADSQFLRHLRPGAVLINTSRGAVVDNLALLPFLKNGHLTAAVLDCWENEPDIYLKLLPHVSIATPHIAGYSRDGKAQSTMRAVAGIARRLQLPLREMPVKLKMPNAPRLALDATKLTEQEVLRQVMRHSYNILQDDKLLREQVDQFEALRQDYPVRREPQAYTLEVKGITPYLHTALKALGFQLPENSP